MDPNPKNDTQRASKPNNPTEKNDPNRHSPETAQESPFPIQPSEFNNNFSYSSSASFSSNSSPISHPYTNNDDLEYRLRELESAMLGSDQDFIESFDGSYSWCGNNQNNQSYSIINPQCETVTYMNRMVSRGDLKELLLACAKAVWEKDTITANWLITELTPMVSVSGEPERRLGAYMLEGLVARLLSSGNYIYKSLKCIEPNGNELSSYMRSLYEACPYFKFGYLSANGAIAEAMKNESRIHIIDFQIGQGSQWVALIKALGSRPGGPPMLRITGVDDAVSAYARGGGVHCVGQRLAELARLCRIPFEFRGVERSGSEITEPEYLGFRRGEPLAVNFAFVLHHIPDESVGPTNHRDRLLRLVKSLSPKVVTLVEQESNVNTTPFDQRFREALDYYANVFESIDANVTLARDDQQRINMEKHCLAREIVNIVACEGTERVERHELLGKWRSRFLMAGFRPYPLSSFVNATIKHLLENYSDRYRLEERDGALFLGWMNRNLVASCAWQ